VCFHHQGVPHKSTDPKSLVSEFDYISTEFSFEAFDRIWKQRRKIKIN
jgi:hypothetical protein